MELKFETSSTTSMTNIAISTKPTLTQTSNNYSRASTPLCHSLCISKNKKIAKNLQKTVTYQSLKKPWSPQAQSMPCNAWPSLTLGKNGIMSHASTEPGQPGKTIGRVLLRSKKQSNA
ncbi:hypothetical protein ACHAW6_004195 [Cyclotella cf. meneghiniana]